MAVGVTRPKETNLLALQPHATSLDEADDKSKRLVTQSVEVPIERDATERICSGEPFPLGRQEPTGPLV